MDYEPISWQKRLGYRVNEARCRAAVFDGRAGSSQCSRKPKDGERYCATHMPDAIEARRKAADERYEASAPFIKALKQIAAGHNDPRSLANEVLAEHGFSE